MKLILGRKENQTIVIVHDGEEMRFTIQEIRGDKVRICFEAPKSYVIVRAELLDKGEAA